MTSITVEQFDKHIQEQKSNYDAMKWRELEQGQIYTITSFKFFNTQFGEACVLSLNDGQKVYSPSSLTKKLKEDKKPLPRYVRPTGRVQSKRNPAQTYYAFDLV